MTRRQISTVMAVLAGGLLSTPAAAVEPACTDTSRACVIAAAATWVDGRRDHDGSAAALAETVRRSVNGQVSTWSADQLRAELDASTSTGLHDVEYFAQPPHGVAIFVTEEASVPNDLSQWVAIRFHVAGGLIDQIEEIFWFEPGQGETNRNWADDERRVTDQVATDIDPSWCTTTDRACLIAAADTYVQSIQTRDYSQTRLADVVRRTQNGGETASDHEGVRANGDDPHPDILIYVIRDERWIVDEVKQEALAWFLTDVAFTPTFRLTGMPPADHAVTVHLFQRHAIRSGLVTEIESIYSVEPGVAPAPSGWEGRELEVVNPQPNATGHSPPPQVGDGAPLPVTGVPAFVSLGFVLAVASARRSRHRRTPASRKPLT